jgi:hypothetical protein
MGLSLTSRGLVGRADRADLHPAGRADPVDLDQAGRADPVDPGLEGPHPEDPAVLARIRDPAGPDPAARADPDPEDPEDPEDLAVLGRVGLAGPADIRDRAGRADPVDPGLAGRVGLADRADIRDLVARVERAGLDLEGLVGLVDQGVNRADPGDLVGPADRAGLVDLVARVARVDRAGQAIRADRHRRHTRPGVLSTAVAPRWAARGTCRTASAHPVTARRLRPQNTDGVGMAGLHPERRRLSGTDRRPRVAGTVHLLPVVGMSDGMGHRATKALRSAISGRSTTTGTTRSRCSTQCSGDGASGSSESGFRCTDTTPKLHGLRTLLTQVRRP